MSEQSAAVYSTPSAMFGSVLVEDEMDDSSQATHRNHNSNAVVRTNTNPTASDMFDEEEDSIQEEDGIGDDVIASTPPPPSLSSPSNHFTPPRCYPSRPEEAGDVLPGMGLHSETELSSPAGRRLSLFMQQQKQAVAAAAVAAASSSKKSKQGKSPSTSATAAAAAVPVPISHPQFTSPSKPLHPLSPTFNMAYENGQRNFRQEQALLERELHKVIEQVKSQTPQRISSNSNSIGTNEGNEEEWQPTLISHVHVPDASSSLILSPPQLQPIPYILSPSNHSIRSPSEMFKEKLMQENRVLEQQIAMQELIGPEEAARATEAANQTVAVMQQQSAAGPSSTPHNGTHIPLIHISEAMLAASDRHDAEEDAAAAAHDSQRSLISNISNSSSIRDLNSFRSHSSTGVPLASGAARKFAASSRKAQRTPLQHARSKPSIYAMAPLPSTPAPTRSTAAAHTIISPTITLRLTNLQTQLRQTQGALDQALSDKENLNRKYVKAQQEMADRAIDQPLDFHHKSTNNNQQTHRVKHFGTQPSKEQRFNPFSPNSNPSSLTSPSSVQQQRFHLTQNYDRLKQQVALLRHDLHENESHQRATSNSIREANNNNNHNNQEEYSMDTGSMERELNRLGLRYHELLVALEMAEKEEKKAKQQLEQQDFERISSGVDTNTAIFKSVSSPTSSSSSKSALTSPTNAPASSIKLIPTSVNARLAKLETDLENERQSAIQAAQQQHLVFEQAAEQQIKLRELEQTLLDKAQAEQAELQKQKTIQSFLEEQASKSKAEAESLRIRLAEVEKKAAAQLNFNSNIGSATSLLSNSFLNIPSGSGSSLISAPNSSRSTLSTSRLPDSLPDLPASAFNTARTHMHEESVDEFNQSQLNHSISTSRPVAAADHVVSHTPLDPAFFVSVLHNQILSPNRHPVASPTASATSTSSGAVEYASFHERIQAELGAAAAFIAQPFSNQPAAAQRVDQPSSSPSNVPPSIHGMPLPPHPLSPSPVVPHDPIAAIRQRVLARQQNLGLVPSTPATSGPAKPIPPSSFSRATYQTQSQSSNSMQQMPAHASFQPITASATTPYATTPYAQAHMPFRPSQQPDIIQSQAAMIYELEQKEKANQSHIASLMQQERTLQQQLAQSQQQLEAPVSSLHVSQPQQVPGPLSPLQVATSVVNNIRSQFQNQQQNQQQQQPHQQQHQQQQRNPLSISFNQSMEHASSASTSFSASGSSASNASTLLADEHQLSQNYATLQQLTRQIEAIQKAKFYAQPEPTEQQQQFASANANQYPPQQQQQQQHQPQQQQPHRNLAPSQYEQQLHRQSPPPQQQLDQSNQSYSDEGGSHSLSSTQTTLRVPPSLLVPSSALPSPSNHGSQTPQQNFAFTTYGSSSSSSRIGGIPPTAQPSSRSQSATRNASRSSSVPRPSSSPHSSPTIAAIPPHLYSSKNASTRPLDPQQHMFVSRIVNASRDPSTFARLDKKEQDRIKREQAKTEALQRKREKQLEFLLAEQARENNAEYAVVGSMKKKKKIATTRGRSKLPVQHAPPPRVYLTDQTLLKRNNESILNHSQIPLSSYDGSNLQTQQEISSGETNMGNQKAYQGEYYSNESLSQAAIDEQRFLQQQQLQSQQQRYQPANPLLPHAHDTSVTQANTYATLQHDHAHLIASSSSINSNNAWAHTLRTPVNLTQVTTLAMYSSNHNSEQALVGHNNRVQIPNHALAALSSPTRRRIRIPQTQTPFDDAPRFDPTSQSNPQYSNQVRNGFQHVNLDEMKQHMAKPIQQQQLQQQQRSRTPHASPSPSPVSFSSSHLESPPSVLFTRSRVNPSPIPMQHYADAPSSTAYAPHSSLVSYKSSPYDQRMNGVDSSDSTVAASASSTRFSIPSSKNFYHQPTETTNGHNNHHSTAYSSGPSSSSNSSSNEYVTGAAALAALEQTRAKYRQQQAQLQSMQQR